MFNKEYGMQFWLSEEERKVERHESKVLFLTKENQKLHSDMLMMRGIIQQQHRQIESLNN